jgi:hypothetical protein
MIACGKEVPVIASEFASGYGVHYAARASFPTGPSEFRERSTWSNALFSSILGVFPHRRALEVAPPYQRFSQPLMLSKFELHDVL